MSDERWREDRNCWVATFSTKHLFEPSPKLASAAAGLGNNFSDKPAPCLLFGRSKGQQLLITNINLNCPHRQNTHCCKKKTELQNNNNSPFCTIARISPSKGGGEETKNFSSNSFSTNKQTDTVNAKPNQGSPLFFQEQEPGWSVTVS